MKATEVQWLEFKSSFVWEDMRSSIQAELDALHVDLEDPTKPMDEIRFIQGKCLAMRHFLEFPSMALEAIELEKQRAAKQTDEQTKEE